jgi:hypothetical protein
VVVLHYDPMRSELALVELQDTVTTVLGGAGVDQAVLWLVGSRWTCALHDNLISRLPGSDRHEGHWIAVLPPSLIVG